MELSKELKQNRFSQIVFWIIPIIQLFMVELFDGSYELHTVMFLPNIVIYYLIFFLCVFSFNRTAGVIVSSIFFYLLGLTNEIVFQFRGTPFSLSDILYIKTAAGVADNYHLKITFGMILSTIIFAFIFVALFVLADRKSCIKNIRKRLLAILLSLVLLITSVFGIKTVVFGELLSKIYKNQVNDYNMKMSYDCNGYIYSLLHIWGTQNVGVPENYDEKEFENITTVKDTEESKPNIIIIMNEAFSDLSVVGCTTSGDYLKFINSDKVKRGTLNVSVLGGTTANTEFEFLTGLSTALFPYGSVPYQTYIKNNTISLPSILNSCGYSTYGFHPYNADSWNRENAYKYLGFQNVSFVDDVRDSGIEVECVRDIISDKSTYDYIIKQYESKNTNNPFFEFCVTMQNHGGYDVEFDNLPWDIAAVRNIDGAVDEKDQININNYINLMRVSDEAFKYLVEYFKNQNEDTIILMFGDHQPSDDVVNGSYFGLYDELDRYKVPYVYWSNCGDLNIPEETSANYLAGYLLDKIGIKSEYFDEIKTVENKFPIVTQKCIKYENRTVRDVQKLIKENKILAKYNRLAYYNIFDKGSD